MQRQFKKEIKIKSEIESKKTTLTIHPRFAIINVFYRIKGDVP